MEGDLKKNWSGIETRRELNKRKWAGGGLDGDPLKKRGPYICSD